MKIKLSASGLSIYKTTLPLPADTTWADVARLAWLRLLAGSIVLDQVKPALVKMAEGAPVQGLELDHKASSYVVEAAELIQVSVDEAFIFVMGIRHSYDARLKLEREFADSEPGSDPTWLTDAFLQLWTQTKVGQDAVDTRLLQQLRPMQLQLSALANRAERLEHLLVHYMSTRQGAPVTESLLRTAPLPELVGICALHGQPIPTNLLRYPKMTREYLLRAFGFATETSA